MRRLWFLCLYPYIGHSLSSHALGVMNVICDKCSLTCLYNWLSINVVQTYEVGEGNRLNEWESPACTGFLYLHVSHRHSLFAYTKPECRWKLIVRTLALLDASARVFIRGIGGYAIRTEISCADPYYVELWIREFVLENMRYATGSLLHVHVVCKLL